MYPSHWRTWGWWDSREPLTDSSCFLTTLLRHKITNTRLLWNSMIMKRLHYHGQCCSSGLSNYELKWMWAKDMSKINNVCGIIHIIIWIYNNVLWGPTILCKSNKYSVWMWRLFCRLLSVPQNIAMDLNNIMSCAHWGFNLWDSRTQMQTPLRMNKVVINDYYHMTIMD